MEKKLLLKLGHHRRLCLYGGVETAPVTEVTPVISMPLTDNGEYDIPRLRKAILECKRRFDDMGIKFRIVAIPEKMKSLLEEAFGDEMK